MAALSLSQTAHFIEPHQCHLALAGLNTFYANEVQV
jgi:hypothetical protein